MSNHKTSDTVKEWLPVVARVVAYGAAGYGIYRIGKYLFPAGTGGGEGTAHTGCNNIQGKTYSDFQYKSFADEIEAYLWFQYYGSVEDDESTAKVLKKMRSIGDVNALVCAYGVRGVGNDKFNLTQSIGSYLDDDLKEEVNQYYSENGINFQF